MKILLFLSYVVLTLGIAGILALEKQTIAAAEFDLLGLNQTVQNHDERLDNHEARLTNVEANVTEVQTNTNTPPSTNTVYVPQVSTPEPEEPAPTVSSSTVRGEPDGKYYCDLIYTDGLRKAHYMGQIFNLVSTPTPPDNCAQFLGLVRQ